MLWEEKLLSSLPVIKFRFLGSHFTYWNMAYGKQEHKVRHEWYSCVVTVVTPIACCQEICSKFLWRADPSFEAKRPSSSPEFTSNLGNTICITFVTYPCPELNPAQTSQLISLRYILILSFMKINFTFASVATIIYRKISLPHYFKIRH